NCSGQDHSSGPRSTMNSETAARFWRLYRKLPRQVRQAARVAYRQFVAEPTHPSLHFHLKGCLPRRELTSEMLLPEGSEKEIDSGFVGVVGAFEVYRGSIGGHRMANLRLVLR